MRSFLLFALLLMTACTSQKLNDGLPYLTGEPIDYAISFLGYPSEERIIADSKVFTWENHTSFTGMRSVAAPFSATSYSPNGSTYVQGSTTSQVPVVHSGACTIRLIADKKNIVRSWEWYGNEMGCDRYSDGLSRLINYGTP